MTDALKIRAAEASDLPSLLRLYAQLNPGDPELQPDAARAILDRFAAYDGSAILLGLAGGTAVTSCALVVVPNLTRGGAPYGLIENVITDAAHRQRGYGTAILKAALDAAWDAGCYKVMLLTGSKRPETLAFYRAAGFAQDKTGFQVRRLAARDPFH